MPKIFIACDFNTEEQLWTFLNKFPSQRLFLKIGMELIYAVGFEIINKLKQQGHIIFLDLKLNDIPITVEKALKALKQYQVDFVTIHLTSGEKTLELAHKVVQNTSIKLLGVTVLTSLDNADLQTLFLSSTLTTEQLVQNLAKLAVVNNFYGVICSPWEAKMIKTQFPSLKTITPGIQLIAQQTDQKRVATPILAKELGADYLVIGRAITMAAEPAIVYQQIIATLTT
ncbi:orotidine-5'-phosphate decarboxylase [Spiroplasma melliferum]|uniref:Orotidine 5'-phosphate decarboxylase n=2 Tax=Spiroplasma melliferum TaxID=2134 RepID=A0AAI9T468_SPIME|nr:orotidine-5'-phosphate decarboxylase [Spiroplasma melliferum]ELL44551.1 orotidine-5'-phosphate decarboxylase [Spiroplasma melliferum IPMB4A]KAI93014.1 orotidine 5'-phosphate decarboxylase [Spiroplasma melliferum KC3]QCO24073.1 orotidine-5'-phosphate decarboxylase [Spiroplasma melliferum]